MEQALDGVERASKLRNLREQYEELLRQTRGSASTFKLLDHLFEYAAVTIPGAQQTLDMSYPGAKLVVLKLVKAGILVEAQKRARIALYVAPGIMNIASL